jgi:hypothetical protein
MGFEMCDDRSQEQKDRKRKEGGPEIRRYGLLYVVYEELKKTRTGNKQQRYKGDTQRSLQLWLMSNLSTPSIIRLESKLLLSWC